MAGGKSSNENKWSPKAKVRGPRSVILAGTVGVCMAAATATGWVSGAAPAKADIEDLLDPIIQPIFTHLADSLSTVDPTLGADMTTWGDNVFAHLDSLDSATAASSTTATADSSATTSDVSTCVSTACIPITIQEDTEPSVEATVNGSQTTLLVDSGSGGLVIPWQDLGTSHFEVTHALHEAGAHVVAHGHSGYSGGVDYSYKEYDNVPVSYGNGELSTNSPVDIVMHSHGTSPGAPKNFQAFLKDDDVTGILGIGDNVSGPTESPLEATGFTGVTVDLPQNELIVGDANPGTAIDTVNGAPITSLYETVTTGGVTKGETVSDDVDSGGVYGTIPSSLNAAQGSTITVYSSNGGTELYSYTVGTDSDGTSELPQSVSGTSIDSGVMPYKEEPIYIDYTNDTMSFDKPLS